MAIINFINTKAKSNSALRKIINYVWQDEKTDEKLVGGKDLMPESAYSEMILTKKEFNKTGGRQYLHMVQSFSPKENIDHEKAHNIALELAQHFKKFQVLVATHKDKDHVHSHFIINSVNFENGWKIQQSFEQLKEVMDKSDDICKRNGLSVIEERKFGNHISRNEYHIAMKGESWKMKLVSNIEDAISCISSKDEYILFMNSRGYEVNWKDNRKYITYTTPDGNKCRCNKLHDEKYTKEEMENVFDLRQNESKEPRDRWSISKATYYNASAERVGSHDASVDGKSDSEFERDSMSDGSMGRPSATVDDGTTKGLEVAKSSIRSGGKRANRDLLDKDNQRFERSDSNANENESDNGKQVANNEDSSWDTGDIGNIIGMASMLLKQDDSNDSHKKSLGYTGDLTKSGKKEKAKQERNVWEEER
jgi:hypothetical protein